MFQRTLCRQAPFFFVLAALCSATGWAVAADIDRAKPTQPEEGTFLLGPYRLGDIYAQQDPHEYLQKQLGAENVPARADMVTALNGCQLYLRDRSIQRDNGTWAFTRAEGRHHCVVVLVAGNLHHILKDRKSRRFIVQVSTVCMVDMHTEALDESDEWREVRVRMDLVLSSADPKVALHVPWVAAVDCFEVHYDARGRLRETKRIQEE